MKAFASGISVGKVCRHGYRGDLASLAKAPCERSPAYAKETAPGFAQLNRVIRRSDRHAAHLRRACGRLKFCSISGSDISRLNEYSDPVAGEASASPTRDPSPLEFVGVVYVLDEPSAGLHPADTESLLAALDQLKASVIRFSS